MFSQVVFFGFDKILYSQYIDMAITIYPALYIASQIPTLPCSTVFPKTSLYPNPMSATVTNSIDVGQ